MLAPIAQITCIGTITRPCSGARPNGANVNAVEITNHSTRISQTPRFSRKEPSSDGLLRAVIRPALVPASSTNTGAQKWVIQRVKKSVGLMSGFAIGSCTDPAIVKSRTWSSAMITIASPRSMSIEVSR